MRSGLLVPVVAMGLLVFVPSPGAAVSASCPDGQVATGSFQVFDVRVASTLSVLQNSGTCTSGDGRQLLHSGSACPRQYSPTDIATVNGSYCGHLAKAREVVACHWEGAVAKPAWVKLFVGFDGNADGKILETDGEHVYGPMNQLTFYTVSNPFATPARIIAFPTDTDPAAATNSPSDQSTIGCGPFSAVA